MELTLPPYGALIHETVLWGTIHSRRADERPARALSLGLSSAVSHLR